MEEMQFNDEMDKLQIDQLHKVVLELAKNCFELKKLCVTVLVSASTLIAVFTTQKLDAAIFIGGAMVVLFFYVADAQSYYYQEKIRIRMRELAIGLAERHSRQARIVGFGMPIEQKRIDGPPLRHAFFNGSMWFYAFLIVIDVLLLFVFELGFLQRSVNP